MGKINTWWNSYILLDDFASRTLVDLLGSFPIGDGFNSQGELQDTIESQVCFYGSLCQGYANNAASRDFFDLLISLRGHTVSNLKPGQLYDIWQLLSSYGQNLNCNFPSLKASLP
jgi:hypothetical protein